MQGFPKVPQITKNPRFLCGRKSFARTIISLLVPYHQAGMISLQLNGRFTVALKQPHSKRKITLGSAPSPPILQKHAALSPNLKFFT